MKSIVQHCKSLLLNHCCSILWKWARWEHFWNHPCVTKEWSNEAWSWGIEEGMRGLCSSLQTPVLDFNSLNKKRYGILQWNTTHSYCPTSLSHHHHHYYGVEPLLSNPQEHINGVKSHKWIIQPIAFLNHAYMSKDEVPGAVVVAAAHSSNLGPYLIKLAKPHASGENPVEGLDYL